MEGIYRVDDTPVHQALREALANCLVNADYYGRRGLVIIKKRDGITFSNPGNSRIELDAAISGGVSDPRNSTMLKMFNFIDIGERAGSGIPNIFRVWREQGWDAPVISESYEPDRFSLSLKFEKTSDNKSAIKISDKVSDKNIGKITMMQKETIIGYLTDHASAKCSEIAGLIGVKNARARQILTELATEGTVVAEGANRNRTYRLKS